MNSRQSQVTKFQAKWSKNQQDEDVVAETELQNSTMQKQAEKVTKNYGRTTEDIFMIIARDSVESFTKMWNNSMESVVRETMRTEIKAIVQETIQQELVAAYTGIVKGLTGTVFGQANIQEMVEEEIKKIVHPEPEIKVEAEKVEQPIEPKTKGTRVRTRTTEAEFYKELNNALRVAKEEGINIKVGKDFKTSTSRNNGLYQKFNKYHAGQKGAWVAYIEKLFSTQPEEN